MSSLIWLPIDYPRLPDISNLLELDNLNEGFAFWRFRRLTKMQVNPYCISEWDDWIIDNCPSLINWFSNLPFSNIRNVKLNYQTQLVKGHIDFTNPINDELLWNNNNRNEPCGYRILIKGSRTNCLWVNTQLGNVQCSMPDTTDVYVLNHTTGMHGVDNDMNRWTIFCHAEIDTKRHEDLVNQSLLKYNAYAIWN